MKLILTIDPAIADQNQPALDEALASGAVAAVILQRADISDDEYARQAKPLIATIQSNEVAALLMDAPGLVPKLGADGAHMTGGQKSFSEAAKKLQPDFIVGAGDLRSRHETMLRGEAGADYLMFGTFDAQADQDMIDLAEWSAETTQIDTALCISIDQFDLIDQLKIEFVVLDAAALVSADNGNDLVLKITQSELVS